MHIVIIGNGVSGITAARYIRKLSDHKVTVLSSESKYFFSRTALMYIYMGHMTLKDTQPYEKSFWAKNKIDLVYDHATDIDFANRNVSLQSGGNLEYDALILALGSKSNKFGWPGQDLDGVGGLYTLQDLEYMEKYSAELSRAVIVGGGLIGIEMAEMFHTRKIPVTMLVRESNYWNNVLPEEESDMVSRHIYEHHIDLRLGVNLEEIRDDGNGRVKSVIIKETGEEIDCGYVGLTAGVSPNVDWLKNTELVIDRGILVDSNLGTNLENVYAIGDCAQLKEPQEGRRAIEAIWYTGRMMGELVAYNVCGKILDYNPGIWFNSAKFFDIEYQVYGDVLPDPPPEHKSLYWEHSDGNKSIRIVYQGPDETVIGFNLMGIRFRQEVCEKWIREKCSLSEVLENICLADFNPEFFSFYEKELLENYNQNNSGPDLELKSKRSPDSVFNFLKS